MEEGDVERESNDSSNGHISLRSQQTEMKGKGAHDMGQGNTMRPGESQCSPVSERMVRVSIQLAILGG